ncbi:MAG: T9SS type A sorting domain-containing protein [Saprospiraceae bacterium]
MKNLLSTLFFALCLTQLASAQSLSTFEVTPNPSDTVTSADTYDSGAHGHIHNTTSNAIIVTWERTEVFLSPGVTTAVCDPNLCWADWIGSKTFGLDPNMGGQLTVHFYNSLLQASSGIVHLKLTNENNAADTMTAVYTYNSFTSGTGELPAPNVRLFPNPTADFFTLENAAEVASLRLFTLDGREVARFAASPDNRYSIANQPVGNYVLSFEDKNGQLFQALELQKR